MNILAAQKTFLDYASGYDLNDVKIKLKADHTLRVADLCRQIAASIRLSPKDTDLACLTGILHDVGRFEQVSIYHTFRDAVSVNHAQFSADLLFKEGLINDYREALKATDPDRNADPDRKADADRKADPDRNTDSGRNADPGRSADPVVNAGREEILSAEDLQTIEKAIRLHNAYRLPEDLTQRERMFCDILRDADKIDILRVNRETPMTDIYDLPEDEFLDSQISDAVYEDMLAHRNVDRANSRTGVDFLMGHIAFVFGLVYPISFRLVKEQGYLDQMLAFESRNAETRKRMERIRAEVESFLIEKGKTS